MNLNNIAFYILAVLVLGFVGVYALIYPNSDQGKLAIGSLLTIAGAIGTYFFHSSSQSFLGTQLSNQRTAFGSVLQLVGNQTASVGNQQTPSGTTGSTSSTKETESPKTIPTETVINPQQIV